jgi:hypothetical protein
MIRFMVSIDEPAHPSDAEIIRRTLRMYMTHRVEEVVPLAEVGVVQSKWGDPEEFGEREPYMSDDDLQKLPYGTKLYAEDSKP